MGFNLSFNISESNDCKSATLCDTTCQQNHYNNFVCCDGYDVDENISIYDIAYTRFHWQLPNGNEFFNLDMGWIPGTRARAEFQVSGGTTGVIVADVNGLILGQVIFITDIATTVQLLITNINLNTVNSGWQAYLKPGTTDTIVIQSINLGAQYNSLPVNVSVSGDITIVMNIDPTQDANGNESCLCFNINDIYEAADCPPNAFPDGVYSVTYLLFNDQDEEIGRVTNKFLFTCLLRCKLNKLILLPC